MKKVLLVISLMFAHSYAATVRVFNESGKTIEVGIPYRDFGIGRAATFIFPVVGVVTTGAEAAAKATKGEQFSWELSEIRKQSIPPGKSAWFDSGLTPIKSIAFFMDGRPVAMFNPDIGMFEVEQKVIFYSSHLINRVK
jgi:hypothetical protein